MTPKIAKMKIEDLVDKVGIMHFLIYVEEICHEKAAHVRETWQDEPLALKWEEVAFKILSANSETLEGM
jgi:hypothetical protein